MSASSFSLDIALNNLAAAFGTLRALIIAISYVSGLALMIRGVMMYRIFANQTFGSAQRGEIAGPMVFLFVGALLFYFPSTMDTSLITLFGSTDIADSSSIVGYANLSGIAKWQAIADICVKYLTLVGYIAFVRGWLILSKMGHPGAQPGSVAKGIVHVIGGILLINIVNTVNMLASTFGYTGA